MFAGLYQCLLRLFFKIGKNSVKILVITRTGIDLVFLGLRLASLSCSTAISGGRGSIIAMNIVAWLHYYIIP